MSENQLEWIKDLSEQNSEYKTEKYIDALMNVRKYYKQFYDNELFLRLKCETLCEILDSNDLNVESEEMVFESVRRWLDSNSSVRETSLRSLLKVVRLPLLPLKYLNDVVKPLLPIYSVEEFNVAFQKVVENYKPFKGIPGMLLREYQMLILEENLNTHLEIKIDSPVLLSIGSDDLETAKVVEIYDYNQDEWIETKSLDIFRINFSVAFIDDKILLIGGSKQFGENATPLNVMESLDLTTGILHRQSSLNDAREHAATIVMGTGKMSFLYVFGGRGINSDLDSVEIWSPSIPKWTRDVQPMPSKRTGLAAEVLNDKIYILGGKVNEVYTNTMEAYDVDTREWETKASMKETRANFCAAAYQGCLYAVAGSKSDQMQVNTVEKYDPSNDSWITIANIMATGHVGVSCFVRSLICAGGKDSKTVLRYDFYNDRWTQLNGLKRPRNGYLIQLPNKINQLKFDWVDQRKLLMIGNRGSHTTCSLEIYDTRINHWTKLNNLNIDKINYSVAYDGNKLLMIGGNLANNYQLNAVESLDIQRGEVSQISPLKYRRQNSAAAFVRRGKLAFILVFGGMKDEELLDSVERWDSVFRTWSIMTSMTVARAGHGAVLLKNRIYVVGGKTAKETYDKTVEAYDYENDRWTPKASMNNPNAYFGITTFKNHIYVAGGNRDAATPISTVERYDPLEDTWTTIANISSTGMVGISGTGDRLICAGGKSSNLVEEYDESKNTWRKLKPLDTQGSSFLVELNKDIEIYSGDWIVQRRPSNRLIFLGGFLNDEAKVVETFDLADEKWTELKDFTFAIKIFFPIIISNKLLLIGGDDSMEKEHAVDLVHAIDLSSGAFQSFPPLKHARGLTSSVVATDGEYTSLYVLGGFNGGSLSSVEKWDPSTNEWTEGIPMITARFGHGCVFLHGKIYAIGGSNKKSLNTVEAFVVKNNLWETKTSMNQKRYYFGITLYNDQIYVAGGEEFAGVERYDPPTDTWTILANIQSFGQLALCTVGDRLICAGEWENNVEEYDVIRKKWTLLPRKNKVVLLSGYLLELPENAKLENW